MGMVAFISKPNSDFAVYIIRIETGELSYYNMQFE
jgi:hypothetical protein